VLEINATVMQEELTSLRDHQLLNHHRETWEKLEELAPSLNYYDLNIIKSCFSTESNDASNIVETVRQLIKSKRSSIRRIDTRKWSQVGGYDHVKVIFYQF
jgi:hypothetical protein